METHFDRNYEVQDEKHQNLNDQEARGSNFISMNMFESEYEDSSHNVNSLGLKDRQEDTPNQSSPRSQEGNIDSLADFLEPNMA